jgi:nucleotide-binding universal stress UspA family protein
MRIQMRRILCPVDFSKGSEHAIPYAVAFAKSYEAELELFHVLELPFLPPYATSGLPELSVPVDAIRQQCEEQLRTMAEKYGELHPRIAAKVVVGVPFVEIIKEARDGSFDMIVMGSHGRSALRYMLMGSVAERVVRKSPCPVLSVKDPEHEFVMP